MNQQQDRVTQGRLAGQVVLVAGAGALADGVAARLCAEAAVVAQWPLPADAAAGRESVDTVVKTHGRLDALVNVIDAQRPPRSLDDLEMVEAPVVRSVLWLMQAAHPVLRRFGGGRIVNLIDAPADSLFRGCADTELGVAAVATLTRVAAEEWGVDGILVNALAVAAQTPAFEALRGRDPGRVDALLEGTPMRRMGSLEGDVGGAVMLLLDESGGFLTGHVLRVDGGQHLTPSPWEAAVPAVDAEAWRQMG